MQSEPRYPSDTGSPAETISICTAKWRKKFPRVLVTKGCGSKLELRPRKTSLRIGISKAFYTSEKKHYVKWRRDGGRIGARRRLAFLALQETRRVGMQGGIGAPLLADLSAEDWVFGDAHHPDHAGG